MGKKIVFLCMLSVFISCEKEMDYKNRFIELDPFEEIDFHDYFDVYITEGNAYSLEIIGDEEMVEYVDFNIENGILSFKNTRKVKWISPGRNKIELHITSLPLKRIEASDGCNIQTVNPVTSEEFGLILKGKSNQANLELNSHTFYYWNYFPTGGKLSLSGKTENLKIWNVAIMSVDAKDLISEYAYIKNSSKGDCEVTVLNKLEYSISGEGNIHLYGQPAEIIEKESSSTGGLIIH